MVYLKAEKAGMKGILFGTGSPYLAVDNSRLDKVEAKDGSNYFIFTKDGKTGVRNTRYENVIEAQYNDVSFADNGYGFILTGSDNLKGFYFLNGKIVSPVYKEVSAVRGGKFVKVKNTEGKSGYISDSLVEFFVN